MERIEVKTERIDYRYKSIDGHVFTDEEECRKYEATAECAVLAQYNKRVVEDSNAHALFGVGSTDENVDVYRVETEEDKKIATELYRLLNNRNQDYVDKFYNSLEYGINFIARGCDNDCIWFIGTPESMRGRIDKIVTRTNSAKNEENDGK